MKLVHTVENLSQLHAVLAIRWKSFAIAWPVQFVEKSRT